MVVKRMLTKFAEEIELHINKDKSQVFFSGCNGETQNNIHSKLGIPKGSLPFWYLGILVTSKKPSFVDCAPYWKSIQIPL